MLLPSAAFPCLLLKKAKENFLIFPCFLVQFCPAFAQSSFSLSFAQVNENIHKLKCYLAASRLVAMMEDATHWARVGRYRDR